MRITERRLRHIIRETLNEMESPLGSMDSYMGAAQHASSISDMLSQELTSLEQLMDPIEALQMTTFASGLVTGITSDVYLSDAQSFIGAGICVGAALWIIIRNYLESGNIMYANRNEAERLKNVQKRIERECPECMNDVSTVEENEY